MVEVEKRIESFKNDFSNVKSCIGLEKRFDSVLIVFYYKLIDILFRFTVKHHNVLHIF